ncbi:MAG: HAMP domain-containing sensor histidine kinase [Desulfobacterales bacterium]|nr:HAMP domain-containing sensor histidine kinase [Desulfobacterales bacterium]
MRHLRSIIVVFALTLALLLALVVWRAYNGLAKEEVARLQYFTEAILAAMESDLAELVVREENRAVDEYNYTFTPPGDDESRVRSPLSRPPQEGFVLGHLQNNPDGSFQTPLTPDLQTVAPDIRNRVKQLEAINRIFNRKKTDGVVRRPWRPPGVPKVVDAAQPKKEAGYAGRFVASERTKAPRTYLGRKTQRVEEITAGQAQNLARQDRQADLASVVRPSLDNTVAEDETYSAVPQASMPAPAEKRVQPPSAPPSQAAAAGRRFQVEVAPLQSVFIDDGQVLMFRRIVIEDRIYRQGIVIQTAALLKHLAAKHFETQPMAAFAALQLSAADEHRPGKKIQSGASVSRIRFQLQHVFPAPFDFLSATIASEVVPTSSSRRFLNIMLLLLVTVFLVGFGAIFYSARTLIDLAERRARFVSSVTHELKTPLTNIRMYIEMLEQGIARDTDREQAYFEILNTESARLSRLINNVLELSRLEKNQRPFTMTTGTFEDVLEAVENIMAAKLSREGFKLTIAADDLPVFAYDREAMIQVLLNLVENSVKFGRHADTRRIDVKATAEGDHVLIAVSDTGPGIPRTALKKIFDDFYRVEGALTRTTGGTGIGLALVRKFMVAMGGTVSAANNPGPGCTITLRLPRS